MTFLSSPGSDGLTKASSSLDTTKLRGSAAVLESNVLPSLALPSEHGSSAYSTACMGAAASFFGAAGLAAAAGFVSAQSRRTRRPSRGFERKAVASVALAAASGRAAVSGVSSISGPDEEAAENSALVFIKPHANTPAVRKAVPEFLEGKGIRVIRSGSVSADDIERMHIIDQHYVAIARIGMLSNPAPEDLGPEAAGKFLEGYRVALEDVAKSGRLHSAKTAVEKLGISPSDLLAKCLKIGYVKLGAGLYASELPMGDGKDPVYVLNGFYARMREKFVAAGAEVHWFVVNWDEASLPWKSFRKEVIGATNPSDAMDGSLRAKIREEWEDLGMAEPTNFQDNGVHASAGPLEAARERFIWLGDALQVDPFVRKLLTKGWTAGEVEELMQNPRLKVGDQEGTVFDLLEDVDTSKAVSFLRGE